MFSVMAKKLLGTHMSHIEVPGLNLGSTPNFGFQLRHILEAADAGSRSWVSTTHMGNPAGVSGSWIQPGLTPAVGDIWRAGQHMGYICSSICL